LRPAAPLLFGCLAWVTALASTPVPGEHPLLDLARELESTHDPRLHPYFEAFDLRTAEHALAQARAPADEECAGSLGAAVFADLHSDVAAARRDRGDFAGAAEAYRRAAACAPRSARVLHNLSEALFNARDLEGAAEYARRAREINPRAVYLAVMAANVDFVTGRWADAMSRYRYAAASEPDRTRAGYWQLLYWLTQMRAGVAKPEFVARRHADGWPTPLLLYLQDQYSEADLVAAVREGEDDYSTAPRDERLCEALFYVGEAHLARHDTELARAYFAAAVNVKSIRAIEHGLALAEIAQLQRQ
jgi:lipoprotein NlpI